MDAVLEAQGVVAESQLERIAWVKALQPTQRLVLISTSIQNDVSAESTCFVEGKKICHFPFWGKIRFPTFHDPI